MKYVNSCLLVLALMSQMAFAEELVFITDENIIKDAIRARTTLGIIESVDLAARNAVISGYTYDFGAVDEEVPVEVKMYNSEYGAYELLQAGMKVEIVYGDVDDVRLVVRVQQLSDSASLGDY